MLSLPDLSTSDQFDDANVRIIAVPDDCLIEIEAWNDAHRPLAQRHCQHCGCITDSEISPGIPACQHCIAEFMRTVRPVQPRQITVVHAFVAGLMLATARRLRYMAMQPKGARHD